MRTSNILLLYWVTATILGATPFPIKAAPPIEQSEIEQAITDLQGGSDLARADLVRNLIELGNRRADEDTKIQSLDSFIKLGAAVLGTRDRNIDTNAKIGIWPTFDALAYGAKFPIFAGTDPASITDVNLRKAYEDALTRHKQTLASFSREKQKDEVASESLAACKRLLIEMNSPKAVERVKQSLAKLADDPWLAARVTAAISPPSESKAEPTSSEETKSMPPGREDLSLNPPAIAQQPPSPKRAPEAKPATPSEEPTSSTPWSVVAVLIVAATGLLWLLLKNRK